MGLTAATIATAMGSILMIAFSIGAFIQVKNPILGTLFVICAVLFLVVSVYLHKRVKLARIQYSLLTGGVDVKRESQEIC